MALQLSGFTVTQLMDRVRGDLGLRGNNLLTDADIQDWAKQASDAIASATLFYRKKEQALSVTASIGEYDLPDDLLALEAVRWNLQRIWPISIENLPLMNRQWQQQSGTPYLYYMRGSTSIGLYPMPSVTSATLAKIDYAANAPYPATTSDKYSVPLGADILIISYCCYRASIKDVTAEGKHRVEIYKKEWDDGLRDLRGMYADRTEGDLLIGGADGRFLSDITPDGFNPYRAIT